MNTKSHSDELTFTIIKTVNERKPQNVKILVALVKEKLPLSEEVILDAVSNLQRQGKIKLDKPLLSASPKLKTYMKTRQASWYWTTITIAALTTVAVFTVPEETFPWSYIRNALGIVFVLLLPGYAFIKALFPTQVPIKTSTENLDVIERLALSFGMSLAIIPIIGIILNYTPWGIRLTPIVLSLLALTLIFATVAVIREHQIKLQVSKTWETN